MAEGLKAQAQRIQDEAGWAPMGGDDFDKAVWEALKLMTEMARRIEQLERVIRDA